MGWYLVIYLYGTSDVLVKNFDNKQECESYLIDHQTQFTSESDIKEVKCEEGRVFQSQGSELEVRY